MMTLLHELIDTTYQEDEEPCLEDLVTVHVVVIQKTLPTSLH